MPLCEPLEQRLALSIYSLEILGTLGGRFSAGLAINQQGEIAGDASEFGDRELTAVKWSARREIRALSERPSQGLAINDDGFVAGMVDDDAALWTNDHSYDFGTLGGPFAAATGINNASEVVGYADVNDSIYHAFKITDFGPMTDLGVLGLSSEANDINDQGEIVGDSYPTPLVNLPVYWGPNDLSPTPLPLPNGFANGTAFGINNSGLIVGAVSNQPGLAGTTACEWVGNQPILLPDLGGPSFAQGVNNAGQVVGYSYTSAGAKHAVLWDAAGRIQDLNRLVHSSVVLQQAYGINDAGEIVGTGGRNGFLVYPNRLFEVADVWGALPPRMGSPHPEPGPAGHPSRSAHRMPEIPVDISSPNSATLSLRIVGSFARAILAPSLLPVGIPSLATGLDTNPLLDA